MGCSEVPGHPVPYQPSGKSTRGRWGLGRIGTMSIAARVCPPARRRILVGVLAALALASSLGGAVPPMAQAATTTPVYLDPPPPTPPDPVLPRPTGKLVPAQGAL